MRALQPVIGINYGAQKITRVIRSFKLFVVGGTVLMLPFWFLIMLKPELVLGLMIADTVFDAESLFYFRTYLALLPILPVIFMAMTFFPAINNGKASSSTGDFPSIHFFRSRYAYSSEVFWNSVGLLWHVSNRCRYYDLGCVARTERI